MTWQDELQRGFQTPEALLDFLAIDTAGHSLSAHQAFKTRVPLSFAKRMQKGNRDCPLLRQVLPVIDEEKESAGFSADPLAEQAANTKPGILHKYHARVLVMLATSCAVNCRYCFRRHFAYQDNRLSTRQWAGIIEYLQQRKEVNEVILSGGDPLMLSNNLLKKFLKELAVVKHIETLRIHTRLPVVIPSRVDDELIRLLSETRFNTVLVYHSNHANELCDDIKVRVEKLRENQMTVLNQSVLLKGVNDSVCALTGLSQSLWAHGIVPYYLHLLDKTQNTAHFEVESHKALALFESMKTMLPGYLLPKLVREEPAKKNKTWLSGVGPLFLCT